MTEVQTRNLGEIFREKLREQWYTKTTNNHNKRKREASGMAGIFKTQNPDYRQGYAFEYIYLPDDGGKKKYLYRRSLIDLYDTITIKLGREIFVEDKNKARNFINKYAKNKNEYKTLFNKIIMKEALNV